MNYKSTSTTTLMDCFHMLILAPTDVDGFGWAGFIYGPAAALPRTIRNG